jgi:peptide/nickel transport system permease protein
LAESGGGARSWRTRGAQAALWTLVLFVASAIYAPFLANDEPYYLRAVDLRALRQAAQSLEPLAREWSELRGASAPAPATEAASRAVELRLETFERHLEAPSALRARVAEALERVRGLEESHASLAALAQALQNELPSSGEAPQSPWRADVTWPLLESLGDVEWFFALLGPAVGVALLLRLRRRTWFVGALAAAALGFALARAFEAPPGLATRTLKASISRRELFVESAVFAPVPYGYDETNLGEALRPPTWTAAAEMDAQGRYVRGRRAAAGETPPSTQPVEVRAGEPSLNCSRRHLLGVDSLGRDVLTRLVWGGRVSLGVAFGAVALMLAIGVALGLAAGYFRGVFDALFLAVVQTLQSFPSFFLILVAVALLPSRGAHPQLATAAVIGLVSWTGVARLVRAEVLSLRELDWVLAARALGLGDARVLWRHLAPNAAAPAIVSGAFALGSAILVESATSFLGFGVQPPIPSWGAVLRESSAVEHWWILLFPGLAVFATVAAANALGDALRAALDLAEDVS